MSRVDLVAFEEHLERYYRPTTGITYHQGVDSFLRFLEREGLHVERLTAEAWGRFESELLSQGNRSTGRMRVRGARLLLKLLARDGAISSVFLPPPPRRSAPPTLPPGLARWMSRLDEAMDVAGLSPTTRGPYRRALRDFLVYLLDVGIGELSEVARDVMTAYHLHLQAVSSTKGAPYAVATRYGALCALRFFFSWLVTNGDLLVDPTRHLRLPRLPKRLARPLASAQIARVMADLPEGVRGLRDRALIEILYGTGMRRAEAAGLTLSDCDLKEGTLLIRQGKGGKDRMVPLGRKAQAALEAYLARRGELLKGETDAVFLSRTGRPLSAYGIGLRVRELGARVGVALHAHLLRHSCATHLLKGHADIRHIQRLLGHKSLRTTERYTRVEVSDLKEVIERCHPRERGDGRR